MLMVFDLSLIDLEQFSVDAKELYGETVYLVQPKHIGCKWTQSNKIFRSSVWSVKGELISAGFPKFVNWGENPGNFPVPTTLKGTTVVEKIDGSLLIVSKYKGEFILRTRGTVNASGLENGDELEEFRNGLLQELIRFMRFTDNPDTWNKSFLFEWTSPRNRIVINYGEKPQWFLVGLVHHKDYSLCEQSALNVLAEEIGCPRPPAYNFPSVEELMRDIEAWKGKEGVVIYSDNGQTLHKVKSADYLVKHRLKEEFSSFEKVMDFYVSEGCPSFHEFQNKIAELTDWETCNEVVGDISKCADAWKVVQKIQTGFSVFIRDVLLPLGNPTDKKNRAEMAKKVLSAYGQTNRASFLFKLLDGRELDKDDLKKLLFQVLKK